MSAAGLTPVSVQLTGELATVTCGTCGQDLELPTADRDGLVQSLRAFLHSHGRCVGAALVSRGQAPTTA
jgi:hypothetical protein